MTSAHCRPQSCCIRTCGCGSVPQRLQTDALTSSEKSALGWQQRNDNAQMLKLKRIYEAPADSDGYRVLVDHLWPRGLSKEKAHVDLWMKEIGPSDRLRKWFGHDPKRWSGFRERYWKELKSQPELVSQLKQV